MSKPSTKPKRDPARPRSWRRRLLRWAGLLLLAGVIAGALGIVWLVKNQTPVVNVVLTNYAAHLGASVGEVSASPSEIILRDVVLRDPTTSKELLKLAEVIWQPEWYSLAKGQLGRVALKDVVLDLDEAKARQLLDLANGPPASPEAVHSQGMKLSSVVLQNVRVRLGGGSLPAAEFSLDEQAEDIDLTDPARPHVKHFSVTLHEVRLASKQGAPTEVSLPSLHLAGSLSGDDGILRVEQFKLGAGRLAMTPALLAAWQAMLKSLPPAPSPAPAPAPNLTLNLAPAPAINPIWFQGFHIRDLDLINVDLQAVCDGSAAMPAGWPHLKGRVSGHITDLSWSQREGIQFGAQKIVLWGFELRPPSGPGVIAASRAAVAITGLSGDGLVQVQDAALDDAVIEWTPELERYLVAKSAAVTPPVAVQSPPSGALPQPVAHGVSGALIERFVLQRGRIVLKPTPRVNFAGAAGLDFEARSLRVDARGASSAQPQTLRVRDLRLAESLPSQAALPEPFAELSSGVLSVIPDAWKASRQVIELTLNKPIVRARDDTTTWFVSQPSPAPSTVTAAAAPVPWWRAMHFAQLAVTQGHIDYANAQPQRVELRTDLGITTGMLAGESLQRVVFTKIKGSLPQKAHLPVASIEHLEMALQWPKALASKRLQELTLQGAELDVGDAVLSMFAGGAEAAATPGEPPPPAPGPLAGWRVGRLKIADTALTLHGIAPGLPPVKFDLNYEALDMPLAPGELAGNFAAQRVELSQLAIRSPYNSRREVIRMDTIFVSFTLDGLLARRIDKVEVISPQVNIGEDLFWYVDYYRKYAAGEALPDAPSNRIALAATDPASAFAAAAQLADKPVKTGAGWTVDTLQVAGGKLIIAPKGTPLPGIPKPFPFSFTTKMNEGHINADLDIPEDTYTWEQMKLQLERMRGRVQFNLPIKSRDNNLNEVFRADRIRYNKLHVEDVHLSVTYDMLGIYGQFGGKAYEGYVNGAFNIYNNDSFTWDGWISGTRVKTTEITQQLSPAYFVLDGKVDLTVVAQGDQNQIYQGDVKLTNSSPGKFNVAAMKQILTSLPKDMASYTQDIMRIGVETLRDFDYSKVEGKARFYGREGTGYLKFKGPTGTRNIDINVYDHRTAVPNP